MIFERESINELAEAHRSGEKDNSRQIIEGMRPVIHAIRPKVTSDYSYYEDLEQEGYMRIHRELTLGRWKKGFTSYTGLAIRTAMIDYMRRTVPQGEVEFEDFQSHEVYWNHTTYPTDVLVNNNHIYFERYCSQLESRDNRLMKLRYGETPLGYPEIQKAFKAEGTSISTGTISRTLRRLTQEFFEYIDEPRRVLPHIQLKSGNRRPRKQ